MGHIYHVNQSHKMVLIFYNFVLKLLGPKFDHFASMPGIYTDTKKVQKSKNFKNVLNLKKNPKDSLELIRVL